LAIHRQQILSEPLDGYSEPLQAKNCAAVAVSSKSHRLALQHTSPQLSSGTAVPEARPKDQRRSSSLWALRGKCPEAAASAAPLGWFLMGRKILDKDRNVLDTAAKFFRQRI
jgi:hypothetical protein